jgi:hypothetical protein
MSGKIQIPVGKIYPFITLANHVFFNPYPIQYTVKSLIHGQTRNESENPDTGRKNTPINIFGKNGRS